jgi:alpha-N-acetylglucosamine transferase
MLFPSQGNQSPAGLMVHNPEKKSFSLSVAIQYPPLLCHASDLD